MVRYILLLLVLFVAVGGAQDTYAQSISGKKKELQRLRSSIKATQKKIDRLSRDEKNKKKSLTSYERQRHQISKFITTLQDDLKALKDSANALQGQILLTQAALVQAEDAYQSLTTNMLKYKAERRGVPEASLMKDAVYQSMSKSLSTYRDRMMRLRDSLAAEEDLLEDYSATRDSVLVTMSSEEDRLNTTIKKSKSEITQIRRSKSSLNKQLAKKQKSAQKLRSLINKLVAEAQRKEEERRRREAAKRKKAGKPPKQYGKVKGFKVKSLPWPTASKRILHNYGQYKNPQTGTTLDNPGIDIAAKTGSTVKSVASGTVSSITFLPGFQSLVIIDHGNGVRSVYANLEKVNVGKGAKVKAGTKLGTSGESIDGPLVHFEIWNGRNRQNPLRYLK